MNRAWVTRALWVLFVSTCLGGAWVSCGGNGNTASNGSNSLGGGGNAFTTSTGMGNHHAGGANAGSGGNGSGGGIVIKDGGNCVPPTCAELNADCGPVTDSKCGGIIQCGNCPSGESCGNGGPSTVRRRQHRRLLAAELRGSERHLRPGRRRLRQHHLVRELQRCRRPAAASRMANQCGCTGVCAQIPDCTGPAAPRRSRARCSTRPA